MRQANLYNSYIGLEQQSSSEVLYARFDEIEGDIWTLPSERTKTGAEHRVPLTAEALAVIEAARIEDGQELIFP